LLCGSPLRRCVWLALFFRASFVLTGPAVTRLIDQDRLPHLLFYGPPGTGKTTTILACARKIYGDNYRKMILELNASDDRGIKTVRDVIKDFASSRQMFASGPKLIILDESDAMSNDAQAALRRVVEKFTANTRFCFICNYVSKIIPALQSRCTKFRFAPLKPEQILPRLNFICKAEEIPVTPEGVNAIVELGSGDMRKCLNILQATHMSFGRVDGDLVYQTTGQPLPRDIETILHLLLNADTPTAYEQIVALKTTKGLALEDILRQIHKTVLRLALSKNESVLIDLLDHMATIEANLATGTSERMQLGGLVGAFQLARNQIAAAPAK
jgi:replication factor C subunit 3/5